MNKRFINVSCRVTAIRLLHLSPAATCLLSASREGLRQVFLFWCIGLLTNLFFMFSYSTMTSSLATSASVSLSVLKHRSNVWHDLSDWSDVDRVLLRYAIMRRVFRSYLSLIYLICRCQINAVTPKHLGRIPLCLQAHYSTASLGHFLSWWPQQKQWAKCWQHLFIYLLRVAWSYEWILQRTSGVEVWNQY